MQFLRRLRENLASKKLKWRRSRRIGVMVERKAPQCRDDQILDVQPGLMSTNGRGGLQEDLMVVWRYSRDDDIVWRYSRDDDIVELFGYREVIECENLEEDGESMERSSVLNEEGEGGSDLYIDEPLAMEVIDCHDDISIDRSFNKTELFEKTVLRPESNLDGVDGFGEGLMAAECECRWDRTRDAVGRSMRQASMERGSDVTGDQSAVNVNHSARADTILHAHHHVRRSKSEERFNKLVIRQNKLVGHTFIKFLPLDRDFQLIKKPCKSGKELSRLEIEAWSTKYQKKRNIVDMRKPKVGTSELLLIKKKDENGFTIYEDDFDTDTKDPIVIFSDEIFHHPRFGYFTNLEYLKSTDSITKPDFKKKCRIELCVSPATLSDSLSLARKKTEMLVACLRTYFNHVADIEVMWVTQLKFHLPRKTFSSYFPLAISDVLQQQLNDCRAILYVSYDVSVLLRHPNTCFLSTLAYCAGVSRHELMVLPLFVKPRFPRPSGSSQD